MIFSGAPLNRATGRLSLNYISGIIDRYYSYGYKLLPQAASVEDAVQDLFVDIWRMRQNLSDAESVKFYLFRSLRRLLYRASEKEKQKLQEFPLFSSAYEAADQQLIDQEKEEQLTQRLTYLLQQLPERQFEVVTLRFYGNFKTHEIADIMGIPTNQFEIPSTKHSSTFGNRAIGPYS